MIRYLLSYMSSDSGTIDYGSVELSRSEPICSLQDVNEVTKELRAHTGLPRLLVMGFSVFAEHGENGDVR